METYATMNCGLEVTKRVFTTEQFGENEAPFKYIVKDLENKLLGHVVFKDKDNDGITNSDLLVILIDRLTKQQEGLKKSRTVGYALARAEESLLWLTKK